MTYENIKTVLLTVLVLTSTLFTWGIWTYKPSYETIENTNIILEATLGEKKEISEIIQPTKVFYHQGNQHLGTVDTAEIKSIIKELRNWNLDGFQDVSADINIDAIYQEYAELIFPDLVPMEIYQSILQVKEDEPVQFKFDKIILDLKNVSRQQGNVYFIDTENEKVYRSNVAVSFLTNFKRAFYQEVSNNPVFIHYSEEQLPNHRSLLVPSNEVTLEKYSYLLEDLPTENFKNALFTDPNIVTRSSISSGDGTISGAEYKDSSTILSVDYGTNTMSYVNPAQEVEGSIDLSQLLKQSIDFVNAHGGWTGNYRFFDTDIDSRTVSFRMYSDGGYPIFDNNGMSVIFQMWGPKEIFQYSRNNFQLGVLWERESTTLESGVDTLKLLIAKGNINPEFLQGLAVGYEMIRDGRLIRLEPAWYYKSQGAWSKVESVIEGGAEVGLE